MTRRTASPLMLAGAALSALCALAFAGSAGAAATSRPAVLVADPVRHALVFVDPVTGAPGVVAASAPLNRPQALAGDAGGKLLTVQGSKTTSALLSVDPASGIATVVSSGAKLEEPIDVTLGPAGEVYVLDRKVDAWGPGKSAAGGVFRVDPLTGAQTQLT